MAKKFDIEKFYEDNEDFRSVADDFFETDGSDIVNETEKEFVKKLLCGVAVDKDEFDIPVERRAYIILEVNEYLHGPYSGNWTIIPVITNYVWKDGDLASCTFGYRAVIVDGWETAFSESEYQKYMKAE